MKEVYLDNSATTMAYRSVGELVQKVMCEDYGNPSSMHNKGVEAEKYIKECLESVFIQVRLVMAALHKISSLQTDVRLLTKTQILAYHLVWK